MDEFTKMPEVWLWIYIRGWKYVSLPGMFLWVDIGRRSENEENIVKDANGNILQNGDSVTIIKDLKVKGASNDLKRGTKVKNIRLIDDGIHNIDCKIDGFGAMKLKSEFVKKN